MKIDMQYEKDKDHYALHIGLKDQMLRIAEIVLPMEEHTDVISNIN